MNCQTEEQLAGLALGVADDGDASAHVEQCDACRAKLAEMDRLTHRLAAAHSHFDRNQAVLRTKLLVRLRNVETPAPRNQIWRSIGSRLATLTIRQRIAAAGIGLSTVVGMTLLTAIVVNLATPLSAMERMARRLRQVTSYSYKLSKQNVSKPGARRHPLIVQREDSTAWLAPDTFQPGMLGSIRVETTILHSRGTSPTPDNTQMTVHIEEIYPSGKPGILIDHMKKTYWRTPPARVDEVPEDSPIRMLQIVREESGQLVENLGSKQIGGKQAHGYAVKFKDAVAFRGLDSVEVWLDPQTDLPLEFRFNAENEWQTQVFEVRDCRWNIDLDLDQFEPTPPAGYDDITPPADDKATSEITAALALYAELSGGHYPRVAEFDAAAVREEMLSLAGFSGEPQPSWNDDEKFQQIARATAGLNWISHILRRKHHAGYYGTTVGPSDEDRALLWWTVEDGYRVIYGNLRSETLLVEQWAKLVPADVAESHLPVE